MQVPRAVSEKEMPPGVDATTEEEYASQAKLLQEFSNIPTINKAWIFKSDSGMDFLTFVTLPLSMF